MAGSQFIAGSPKSEYWTGRAPTVTDDNTAGFVGGSRWFDTSGQAIYECVNAAAGAAVWQKTAAVGFVPGQGSTGPMGLPGADGIDGEDGIPGPQGAQGQQGIPGSQGHIGWGMDGEDGEQGVQGPPGIAGPTGLTGSVGGIGPQGIMGFGMDGLDGADGWPMPGIPGPTGATGAAGAGGEDIVVTLDSTNLAGSSIAVVAAQVQTGGVNVSERRRMRLWVSTSSYGNATGSPPTPQVLLAGASAYVYAANADFDALSDGTGLIQWKTTYPAGGTFYFLLAFAGKVRQQAVTFPVGMFTVDVNGANHTSATFDHWTDGAFPANVQPAPLWPTGGTSLNVYIEVTFPAAKTYAVTIDGGTNSNIGSIAMYATPTTTSATVPSGSPGGATSFNTGSPGGKYGIAMGSVVIAAPGTYRIWFQGTLFSWFSIKYLYLT